MITPFLDAGYWFFDAGQGEPHRERSHKTVFANEWDVSDKDGSARMTKSRRRRKKNRPDCSKKLRTIRPTK